MPIVKWCLSSRSGECYPPISRVLASSISQFWGQTLRQHTYRKRGHRPFSRGRKPWPREASRHPMAAPACLLVSRRDLAAEAMQAPRCGHLSLDTCLPFRITSLCPSFFRPTAHAVEAHDHRVLRLRPYTSRSDNHLRRHMRRLISNSLAVALERHLAHIISQHTFSSAF